MRYVALLRAINVGGRTVKMDRLRELFTEAGMRDVQTYIASGNVIFESRAAASTIERRIERHLEEALGFEVPTILRSIDEIRLAANRAVFADQPPPGETGAMYVGFVRATPAAGALAKLDALANGTSLFALHGRELYWRMDDRRTVLDIPIAKFERVLGCVATFRNLTTVQKLAERYGQ